MRPSAARKGQGPNGLTLSRFEMIVLRCHAHYAVVLEVGLVKVVHRVQTEMCLDCCSFNSLTFVGELHTLRCQFESFEELGG